jgi:anion-transporting  ArsA/GET3 family ATPase
VTPCVPRYVTRISGQEDHAQEHLRTIAERFDTSVRAVVPLFSEEVRGAPKLAEAAQALFA